MKIIINGEQVFSAQNNAVAVGATTGGYTLNYSVDGKTWTAWTEPTPANETLLINGCTNSLQMKLAGNTGDVEVLV